MGQAAGRIVALGLTLIVGGLAGLAIARATETPAGSRATSATVTITTTETVSVVAEPVTVTAEPGPSQDPSGPKANGNYLVGAELAPGTWQCSGGSNLTAWFARDQAGDVTANWGAGTIAVIPSSAYIADLLECSGTWARVG